MSGGALAAPVLSVRLLAVPDDTDKAAPLGLLVVVILGVACYFLFKSMSRHLRRVRENFPLEPPAPVAARPSAGPPSTPPPAPGDDSAQPDPADATGN